MTKCNCKNLLLSIIVAYVAFAIFNFLYHGIFMMPYYQATSELWRDEASMAENLPFMYVGNFLLITFAALIFRKGVEGKNWVKEGLHFGFLLGGLLASTCIAAHSWMVVTTEITILWVLGAFIQGAVIGLALAAVYKK